MSFMKKALASIGIGAAKVNTKLDNSKLIPGEKVTGVIDIQGGNVAQNIGEIYLAVTTSYIREVNDKKVNEYVVVGKTRIAEPFTIQTNERKEIPFQFTLPIDTPATKGRTKVWIHTGLDIDMAVDPSDRDYIEVLPHPFVHAFLEALNNLGFTLRHVDCEAAPARYRKRLPFVQEFEFVPMRGSFYGKLDELEAIFFVQENQVEVILEIDRRARGLSSFLSELAGTDETKVRLTVTEADLQQEERLARRVEEIIQRYS